MLYRAVSLPLVALTVAGCSLFNGKCTYEVRNIQLAGRATQSTQSGTRVATAQASYSEQRGSVQGASLSWIVNGTTLKGHVLSASLKDAQNPSQVLIDFPLAPNERTEIAEGATDTRAGVNLSGYHDILSVGRGIVVLQTDLSATPTVVIPLEVTGSEDWTRPYCS